MEVGLGPGHIILDGDPASLAKKGNKLQFSDHVCCGQMAGWIKMPFGTEVDLAPGDIVTDGNPARRKGDTAQHRVVVSVSTSRSRDGLETYQRLVSVSSRPKLSTSRSRLGLGRLTSRSRLGLGH